MMHRCMKLMTGMILLALAFGAYSEQFYSRSDKVPEEKRAEWEELFRNGNAFERIQAVREGAHLHVWLNIADMDLDHKEVNTAEIVAQWEKLTKDENPQVRLCLVRELRYVHGRLPLSVLLDLLKDDDERVRLGAYEQLKKKQKKGFPLSASDLMSFSEEEDPKKRVCAFRLMQKHPSYEVFQERVIQALEDSDSSVREAALDYVFDHPELADLVEPVVKRLWASSTPGKRRTVLRWARNSESDLSNEIILGELRESQSLYRFDMLKEREIPGATDIILERTDDKDLKVRKGAYKLVAEIPWFPADMRRKIFEKGIQEEDYWARMQAFVILGGEGFENEDAANAFVRKTYRCWDRSHCHWALPTMDFISEAAKIANQATIDMFMRDFSGRGDFPSDLCRAIGRGGNLQFIPQLYRNLRVMMTRISILKEKKEAAAASAKSGGSGMRPELSWEYESCRNAKQVYIAAIANIFRLHPELKMQDEALLESGLQAYMEKTPSGEMPKNMTLGSWLDLPEDYGAYALYEPGWLHVLKDTGMSGSEGLLRLVEGQWIFLGMSQVWHADF